MSSYKSLIIVTTNIIDSGNNIVGCPSDIEIIVIDCNTANTSCYL